MHGKKLFWWLNQHTAICKAPGELDGIGSFGGDSNGTGGNGDVFDGGGQQQQPLIGVPGQEGESENPLDDVLNMFADDADDDDDDNGNGNPPPTNEVPNEQIQAMRTHVQNAISNMRITDDAIPQDFDANDRTQLVGLMNKVMQQTIAQSMNVVFQPVQLAMKQMAMTLTHQMESKINESRTGMQDSAILESMVPEVNDSKYSGMVKSMDATLKTKGKTAKERATAIRKMLNQMGIQGSTNSNNRRTSNPNGGNPNASVRTGHAALDSFFGAFQPPNNGQQNNGGRR